MRSSWQNWVESKASETDRRCERPLPLAAELRIWPGRHEVLPLPPVFEEQNTRPPTLVFKFYILDANFKADCQDAGVEWTERAHFPLWRDAYCRFFGHSISPHFPATRSLSG